MNLPSNVGYCTLTGRFLRAVADSDDFGLDPDGVPLAGLKVVITPSVRRVRNVHEGEATTIFLDPITAETNTHGYLVLNDDPRVRVVGSDNESLVPSGWTYTVAVSGPNITAYSFSIVAPVGQLVDLSVVVPVPSNPGAEVAAWAAIVAQVTEMRDAAESARVVAGASAAEAANVLASLESLPGIQGPQGDKGPTGDKGLTGDKGATGDKGPTGDPGTVADTGWILITAFLNDFTAASVAPAYKIRGGVVYLSGQMLRAAAPSNLEAFTLPVGARPRSTFQVAGHLGWGHFTEVSTFGSVRVTATQARTVAGAGYSLEGISFPIA